MCRWQPLNGQCMIVRIAPACRCAFKIFHEIFQGQKWQANAIRLQNIKCAIAIISQNNHTVKARSYHHALSKQRWASAHEFRNVECTMKTPLCQRCNNEVFKTYAWSWKHCILIFCRSWLWMEVGVTVYRNCYFKAKVASQFISWIVEAILQTEFP